MTSLKKLLEPLSRYPATINRPNLLAAFFLVFGLTLLIYALFFYGDKP